MLAEMKQGRGILLAVGIVVVIAAIGVAAFVLS